MSFALDTQKKLSMATDRSRTNFNHHNTRLHMNNSAANSHDSIIHLQQTIGNQAVQRLVPSNKEPNFAKIGIQPKLRISQSGDEYEQEADRVAVHVMRMTTPDNISKDEQRVVLDRKCTTCEMKKAEEEEEEVKTISRMPSSSSDLVTNDETAEEINNVRSSGGSSLDVDTKEFMESRFGYDFSSVRIHTGETAARSADSINALAYTVGQDIVFGEGQYQPSVVGGRRLLAHELTHIVQQNASNTSLSPAIQRVPTIGVLPADFIGPPSASQRRASVSSSIVCGGVTLGALHSMGLFYHASRGTTVAAGSSSATGIGTSLHFMKDSSVSLPAGSTCRCDDFKIIQVLETTHPAAGRGNSYVDNAGSSTPFYGDVYLSGSGEHEIPAGYPDAGERISTTHSIYDRPYREEADLGHRDLRWEAESCVACIKNTGPDKILGGITYGFSRHYDTTKHSYDPVIGIGPAARSAPSSHFLSTLRSDPTISGYDFEGR